MMEKSIAVKLGLDASQAALFVQTASKFKSSITLEVGSKEANAKSIMGMISLGLLDDCDVTIKADGDDEREAISALSEFMS
ncbi:MAG: HPr family phosphocarrier protein [Lachnospirales bacterium]